MASKKSASSSSSSSSSSVVDEMPEMPLKNQAETSSDEDDDFSYIDRLLKTKLSKNKVADLRFRARQRQQDEFQSTLERLNNIRESLEIEKVEKSTIEMEWVEELHNTFDEIQVDAAHNVRRLQENFRKMQEVASKLPTLKQKVKQERELDPKVVSSIQSLLPCPSVAALKAYSNTASAYSSRLISVVNSVAQSGSCDPATSKVLKRSAATIENLNKAFQELCLEIQTLKTPQKESKAAQDSSRAPKRM